MGARGEAVLYILSMNHDSDRAPQDINACFAIQGSN